MIDDDNGSSLIIIDWPRLDNGFAIVVHEGKLTVCWIFEMLKRSVSWLGFCDF